MSDNMRIYKAIRDALKYLYPKEPQGNIARRLNVLAALMWYCREQESESAPDSR